MTSYAQRIRPPLIGAALGIAAIALVGPLVMGRATQDAYRGLLGRLLAPLPTGWVIHEHYDHGWFSSRAEAELVLQPGPDSRLRNPIRIRLDSRIDQGPGIWLSPALPPVIARIETRVELVDQPLALPPMMVQSEIRAGGGAKALLLLPAGEQAGQDQGYRLQNGAIRAEIRADSGGETLTLDLTARSLALLGARGEVASLTDARLKARAKSDVGGLHSGTADLKIASANLRGDDTGSGIEALHLRLDRGDDPDHGATGVTFDARQLRLDGRVYGSPRLRLAANGLDNATIAELRSGISALTASTDAPALRGLIASALMERILRRLAETGGSLTIDPLHADTPHGPVDARLQIAIQSAAADGTLSWFPALTGECEVALPKRLALDWLATADDHHESESSPVPTDPPLPAPLRSWVDSGWVADQDGQLTTTIGLADGSLTINGRVIPLQGP